MRRSARQEGELASDVWWIDANSWLAQYDLRTARRVWRMVVLATQRPATMVLPTPQPAATCVIMPSG
ncbi:MAG: hypothetical protein AUI16_22150 [Alphaproteobacteria bacterium 13_2_20CM_2_64_7]|nr:MAG: hypothetical protein AUI16_22150 [Alphaproteobacteria bacterium 13_2_20CM_2_64_7]